MKTLLSNGLLITTTQTRSGLRHVSILLPCLLFTFLVLLPLSVFNVLLCEGVEDLLVVMQYDNFHLTTSLKAAQDALFNLAGVYCIKCLTTGGKYIGSTMNIGERLVHHIFNNSSNLHLQHAIALYGLPAFVFSVVEIFEPHSLLSKRENRDLLLAREQHWLDWLFALPAELRYNFSPTAGSRLGYQASAETRAKMATSEYSGSFKSGENNPKATAVIIKDLQGIIVAETLTAKEAGEWLGVSRHAVSKAIKRGSVINSAFREEKKDRTGS
jgi:hypothetical protein